MDRSQQTERHLAVMTNWGLFGPFGLCLALSGFSEAGLAAGLIGFGLIVLGFAAHVLINRHFGTGFSEGEVALGFVLFTLAVLTFVVSWLAAADFGLTRMAIGLAGFAALIACFVFYMSATHGVRGSIAMLDDVRRGQRGQ